ncbi:MAG: Amuc_1100 family pilus-like protein [Verrucomicrobiae bacterium]|nr:Amuc_1100 family pilus-like protein [Verrucomicrobiae bacterium]
MAWIKRNLFFVIGGVVALGLLGAAGFYIYTAWGKNAKASADLVEVVGNLKTLADQKPPPGNDKVDNIKIALGQDKQVKQWVASAAAYFEPIPSIPPAGSVNVANFSGALQNTLKQLRIEAEAAGVSLPPQYDFSFASEKNKLTFSGGGLEPLAAQLGEVKAICEILFAARINALDGIQRVHVSDDDQNGSQSDYIEERPITNDLAVITPYVVTFRCFTPELSRVVGGLAKAPGNYIIKTISVQPAGAAAGMPGGPGYVGEMPPGGMPMTRAGEGFAPPMQPPAGQPTAGKGALQTVLKEQLLRVTAEVELVKLLPKN